LPKFSCDNTGGFPPICFCVMMAPVFASMAATRLSIVATKTVSKTPFAPKFNCET
jgi:hypothetical protein